MIQVEFGLNKKIHRPVLRTSVGENRIDCMIDTGAEVPVWLSDRSDFKFVFGDIASQGEVRLSGFGGNGFICDVYRLPVFDLRDCANNSIVFSNVLILLPENPTLSPDADMIIPAPMLSGCVYAIDNLQHRLVIRSEKSEYHMKYEEGSTVAYSNSMKESLEKMLK